MSTEHALAPPTKRQLLCQRYREVRRFSEQLCEPLEPEDFVIQSMPDVSPTRWHLAHTTWFFETFVLAKANANYRWPNPAFEYLFNSYYNAVGKQFPRSRRGLLSRPTVAEVFQYRQQVDADMRELLRNADDRRDRELLGVVELGLHHEQQHQELMLTDIKHVLSCNPLYPAYRGEGFEVQPEAAPDGTPPNRPAIPACEEWIDFEEQLAWIGHEGSGFAYDNELPRHQAFVSPFQLASRPVTVGQYLAFIDDGGYRRPEWWLSMAWQHIQDQQWEAPLYWVQQDAQWMEFTLEGLRPLDEAQPVCHVSYFEADAFARWAGARLPTEAQWEVAAHDVPLAGNFADSGKFHPQAQTRGEGRGAQTRGEGRGARDVEGEGKHLPKLHQMFGDVWEWTGSQYLPYPGYRPTAGAIGEYNGKFMCNQFVLRGGSCATSAAHVRPTYRNFFPPEARWQFTGIRLAR